MLRGHCRTISSMPPKRCVALTKTGERCKNRGNLTQEGLCFRHSKSVQRRNAAPPEKVERKTTFDRIERTVKIAGAAAGGISGLMKIADWVVTHWPAIAHFFYSLEGNRYDFEELKRRVDSDSIDPYTFAYSVEQWYARLPSHVRMETERRFGDVRVKIQQSTRESL
jgi:hypothetical protein